MSTENKDELIGIISGLPPPEFLDSLDPETRALFTFMIILLKVYSVLVFTLGSFGNLLSFCVLIRTGMRRYSTFCYLACLALVDLGVIITFSVNFISLYHFDYDIQAEAFKCKLYAFCIYFLPQYSSWILVAVSIDRVISAKYLRLAKTWSKPKHSVFVTFLLGVFLGILNGHFFLYENNSTKQRNPQQTNIPGEQQRLFNNDSSLVSFFTHHTLDHYHGQDVLLNSFSGSGASDSSVSYEPVTPLPMESVNRDTTLQDQLNNVITVTQNSLLPFDVNVIFCSMENTKKYQWLYAWWVWIDLAMNVLIPFTGKIPNR
ncbi:unnamed protein product [Rotaria magnacalcarata]|uniref:G-protein coupled receptors family 1 profile domain-containing protein n=1 Tax=Rotaria magnacalcarata TaxID=392030 RepID=A0A816MK39_9BILA|nr:unnamed protein product [Rotaria magnacalcarata]